MVNGVAEGVNIRRQSRRDICQRVEPPSYYYGVPRHNAFHFFMRSAFGGVPRIAFNRGCIFQKRREDAPQSLSRNQSQFVVSSTFYFFENFAARFPEKDIRGRRLRHKTGLRRFWRWSSRESAWPISKLISAMGGTLGASTKGDATLATFFVVVPAAF